MVKIITHQKNENQNYNELLEFKLVRIHITNKTRYLTPVIPALWEAEDRSSRPAWSRWLNPVSTKNTKINWVRSRVPVVPATQEAEAEELLEPGRWRLQ